ncbi:Hypothetical predicted protein [Drosophila guanche]|uniref:Uncharacterized protein n=3 Tax=Drosophila guanche TaxID=7266 RepID=A0A3B0JYK7_DROGU|nr:Hypothetical predicted protein [Drosophila guanche]
MLIEIYDYAAKLLNNMTATAAATTETTAESREVRPRAGAGAGAPDIINKQSVGNDAVQKPELEAQSESESESNAESSSPSRTANLTTKLLQATTGNMRNLLNRTLGTMARANPAQHTPLPTLLLQAALDVDVTQGQRIDQPPHQLQPLPKTQSHQSLANATFHPLAGGEPADIYSAFSALPGGNLSGFIESSTTAASSVLSSTLPATSSMAATFQAQTVATFIAAGNKNRPTTIVVYPTVSPESIVIPIVSCIFGFPILALIVICCLRRRAKLARERDRRRNYDMQDHAVSLVRFSPIHRLNYRSSRAISLRPERSLSQGFTSLELDTVLEERCSDVEQTQTEILNPESPMDTTSYKMSFSSS